MATVRLTEREQLIETILQMSEDQIMAVAEFIQNLEDNEDLAIIEARKDEVGIPLDDALKELGFTRQQLMGVAKAEGLVK